MLCFSNLISMVIQTFLELKYLNFETRGLIIGSLRINDQSDQLEKINHFSEFDIFDRSRGPDRKHLKPSSFHLQSGDRIFTTRFYFSVLQPSSWRPHNIHEITLNSSKSFPICNDYLKVRPEAKDLYFEIVQKVFCNGTRFLLERNWHWISKLLSSKERKRKTIVEEERKVKKLWGVPRDSCTIVSLHFQSLVIYSFFFHLFFTLFQCLEECGVWWAK